MKKLNRREILTGAAAASAVAAVSIIAAPAIAQSRLEWKMVTSWPKGLPGLGTGAERLAKRITDLSSGRLSIKVYSAGELVPALQCFDAVSNGTAEIAHDASYYHLSKSLGTAFFTAVPFGLTAAELNAWVYFGGGQELWDDLYESFGIRAFLAGNTGVQMAGWYRKEIKSLEDMKGLKFRMPGQGGDVLRKLGVTVVTVPGGEIFANLQSGAIDGAEWVGPYNDLALGFYKVAKFYYWPGFHEPGAGLECMINKSKFEALPKDLQELIMNCCRAENDLMLAELNARNGDALETLIRQHGVQLKQLPKDVLEGMGNAAGEVVQDLLDKGDPKTKKIAESYVKFRTNIRRWTQISDQAYVNARSLNFKYPG